MKPKVKLTIRRWESFDENGYEIDGGAVLSINNYIIDTYNGEDYLMVKRTLEYLGYEVEIDFPIDNN